MRTLCHLETSQQTHIRSLPPSAAAKGEGEEGGGEEGGGEEGGGEERGGEDGSVDIVCVYLRVCVCACMCVFWYMCGHVHVCVVKSV